MRTIRNLIVGLSLVGGATAWAETVEFTLNPPLERPMQMTRSVTYSVFGDRDTMEPQRSEQITTGYEILVTVVDGQWWLSSRIMDASWTVNGQPSDLPMDLIGSTFRFAFDGRGRAVEVQRTAGLATRLQVERSVLGWPKPMDGKAIWQDLYGNIWGNLAGRTVDVGSSWEASYDVPLRFLGLGIVPVRERWMYQGLEAHGRGPRAHLAYMGASDVVPLNEEIATRLKTWVANHLPGVEDYLWSSVTLQSEGDLLIDPETLFVRTERQGHNTLTFTAEAPSSATLLVEIDYVRRWSE